MNKHRKLINQISMSCKKLENLHYLGRLSRIYPDEVEFTHNKYIKLDLDEIEFSRLKNLSVCFLSDSFSLIKTLTQDLFRYFTRKCPNLNKVLKQKVEEKEFLAIYGRCE